MRVFVTGATGAIGSHAVPALVGAGQRYRPWPARPPRQLCYGPRGAPVEVSLFDRAALTDVLAGHDAVVNLATAIPPMSKFMSARACAANQRVRTDGSSAVVDAARTAGVVRVVQESVCLLYADGGGRWLDEDAPTHRYPMAEGNHAAEANTARFADAGGVGVVLRFGWFYGPGAAHSEQMLAQDRHHVIDAGTAVAAALDVPGGVYNVVDDEPLTKRDFAAALAVAGGCTPWMRGPGRAARLFGDHLSSLTRSVRATNTRLRSASGWTPHYPSAREGWLATAQASAR